MTKASKAHKAASAALLAAACACTGGKYLEDVQVETPEGDLVFYKPEQVTAGNESSFAPDLSPNGAFVVYTSDRNGNKDVWEKATSGGFGRVLTTHPADDFSPVISPDGSRIAFVSRRIDAAGDIHVKKLGFSIGGALASEGSIDQIESKATEDTTPAWYPDAKKLVFAARRPGEKVPALMVAQLSDLKATPLGEARGDQPTVSPDGMLVAFVRDGAIYMHNAADDKIQQITDGGKVQDGQPRFSPDGTALVFIRYADDTNGDGRLNGDDHPTVWRLDLARHKAARLRENFEIEPLTSSVFAAFSPHLRPPFLYVALQTNEGLDIFRLPDFGQLKAASDIDGVRRHFEQQADPFDKTLVLRRAQAAFARSGQEEPAAEAALLELEWHVRGGRRVESEWVHGKMRANFAKRAATLALADLAMVRLDLRPLAYPAYKADLNDSMSAALRALLLRSEEVVTPFAKESDAQAKRVIGQALLVRAQILAAQRKFFEANETLAKIAAGHADDRLLAAEAAHYRALITPATSDVDAAIRAFRGVVETYPENRDVTRRAAQDAVAMLAGRPDYVEALAALRTSTRGLPVLPALAHMRISEHYAEQKKEPVAANELRQIVDLYPESPEVVLEAAKRLSVLEEKEGRYDAAEAMLGRLQKTFASARPEDKKAALNLLVVFLLRRAESFMKVGEYALALKEYRKVIEMKPLSMSAHRGLIDASYRLKQIDEVTARYAAEAEANPQSAERQYFHGYALTYAIDDTRSLRTRMSTIETAIEALENARQTDAQIMHVHQTLGWLYLQKGYWREKYYQSGSVLAKARKRAGMVSGFLGFGDPNWLELAIDSFQTAYFLAGEGSFERAGLAQNLGQTYFELKNYQKSLAYYMQRIRQLPLIPMRDAPAEGILWRRAGRAAFQVEELELAESLQRNALAVWEKVADDDEIAYSIDALALTIRERGRFVDALALYERLRRLHERIGARENLIGTLSNLGYCAYMDGQYQAALTYFDEAEKEVVALKERREKGEDVADASKAGGDAIQVDLGGQGSAAKGFDLFARQNLIVTFRAKIYEKVERPDLALETYQRKLALLLERREKMIDDEDAPDKALAEEIAVIQNNIGELQLAGGMHELARTSFKSAEDTARLLRPEGQPYMSKGELVNGVNHARVQLRLAELGVLTEAEIDQTVQALDQAAEALRPVYLEGSKADGKPLAQMLALSSSLKAARADRGGMPMPEPQRYVSALEESLDIMKKLDVARTSRDGALLAYSSTVSTEGGDADIAAMVASFKEGASGAPNIEWRLLASGDEWERAFEAIDRYVYGGGTFRSPTDRLQARRVFEALMANVASTGDADRVALLMRRYLLMRHTELVLRAMPVETKVEVATEQTEAAPNPKAGRVEAGLTKKAGEAEAGPRFEIKLEVPRRLQRLLSLKETDQLVAALGEDDVIVVLHRLLGGGILAVAQSKAGVVSGVAPLAPKAEATPAAVAAALTQSRIAGALPKAGGRLYLVPSAELYAVAFDKVMIERTPLMERYQVAYLAAPDVLPELRARRSFPKSSVGFVAALPVAEAPVEDAPETALRAANVARDFAVVATDTPAPLGPKLGAFNIVHVDAPLRVNDVEPARSVIAAGDGKTSTSYVGDLTLKQLAGLDLSSTMLLVLGKLERANAELVGSTEGHDGWVLLSLAAGGAGVATVVAMEPGKPDWQAFYGKLGEASVAEAAHAARLPGRVLGYAGITAAEEIQYAKDKLAATVEEAEQAEDDSEFGEAASAYKRALYFATRTGAATQANELLGRVVNSLYQKRDYVGALHFKKKVAANEKGKDAYEYASATLDAAVLAVRGLQFEEAEQLLAEAEKVFAEEDEVAQLGKVWHYRGINLENQGKYEATIEAYKKSRELYAKGTPKQAAARLLDIGNIYRNNLSDYTAALEYYDLAIEELRKLDDREAYLPVLIDKANTQMAIGQLERAINLLERVAIPAIDKDKQRVLWVRAKQILANAFYRAGVYQEAQDLNDQAFVATQSIESAVTRVDRQIDAMSLRGMILAKLGQHREAFQVFREAIALANEFKLKGQIALLYNNYGFWVREYGAVDQSIEFFNVALKIDQDLKSRSSIAFDQRNLGLSIILKGDYNRARDLLGEALKTSEELNLAYNTAYCYFGLGDVALREEKWEEATGHFEKALAISKKGYMQDFIWRAHGGIAAAAAKRGELTQADKAFKDAIAVIERLRAGLKSEASRNAFQSDSGVQEVYEGAIAVLMGLKKVEAAWTLSERSRARAFIDSLGTQKLKLAREESAKLLEEEKDAKSALETAERRTGRRNDKDKGENDLAAAQKRYEDLLQRMRATDKQLAQFVTVDAITKEELARLMPADTALVQYLATKDQLIIWVLRNGRVTGRTVKVAREELHARVRDFRMLMQNFSSTDYLGKELADLLIAPVASDLGDARRLAIVPHHNLHFLPFAALPDGGGHLVDRFAIYYLDSASVARFTHGSEPKRAGDRRILALANPSTSVETAAIPFAAREADVIRRYFPRLVAAEGDAAQEALVRRSVGDYDVLHIASHGEFKPNAPGESRLLLAPGDGADGFLQVNEIFGLSGRADLVTLSACDTGLGRLSPGDEIIGMNRAFFYAGANTVVSSLWRISDVTSAVVMKRFYRYMSEGHDKAEAMRRAQLLVRRYHAHPAYWSSFRVAGDWR